IQTFLTRKTSIRQNRLDSIDLSLIVMKPSYDRINSQRFGELETGVNYLIGNIVQNRNSYDAKRRELTLDEIESFCYGIEVDLLRRGTDFVQTFTCIREIQCRLQFVQRIDSRINTSFELARFETHRYDFVINSSH